MSTIRKVGSRKSGRLNSAKFEYEAEEYEGIPTATVIAASNGANYESDLIDEMLDTKKSNKKPPTKQKSKATMGSLKSVQSSGSNRINNIKSWPDSLRNEVIKSFSRPPNSQRAKQFFESHKWPPGLYETVVKSVKKIPIRFYIVDDSGKFNCST